MKKRNDAPGATPAEPDAGVAEIRWLLAPVIALYPFMFVVELLAG